LARMSDAMDDTCDRGGEGFPETSIGPASNADLWKFFQKNHRSASHFCPQLHIALDRIANGFHLAHTRKDFPYPGRGKVWEPFLASGHLTGMRCEDFIQGN